MAVTPTYPGVYIQEVPSGVRTIVGAPTSIGLFMGAAAGGPVGRPVQCLNYSDFRREFGDDSQTTNLGRYLKLFFANGGTNCYVMRLAAGADSSRVDLLTEDGSGNVALTLTAKEQGQRGNMIRAAVTYSGARPESTFNIDIFRWLVTPTGARQRQGLESFKNLTMDPTSPSYAVDYITQNSALVDATVAALPVAGTGYSQSGLVIRGDEAALRTSVAALCGTTGASNELDITVGGAGPVHIDLSTVVIPAATAGNVAQTRADIAGALETFINGRIVAAGITGRVVVVTFEDGATANATSLLRIASAGFEVVIRASAGNDLAGPFMLGVDQGGLEVGPFASVRPAPTGIVLLATDPAAIPELADAQQADPLQLDITAGSPPATTSVDFTGPFTLQTTAAADPMSNDNFTTSLNGNNDGVREKLAIIVNAINTFAQDDPDFAWHAELWGNHRLAILSTLADASDENLLPAVSLPLTDAVGNAFDLGGFFVENVRYYSLGNTGAAAFQTNGANGSDGTAPTPAEYTNAFATADTEVDLFNLMVLSPDATEPLEIAIYGEASVFCKRRRAFLVMDAPSAWRGVQQKAAIAPLRIGLEKQFSAIYYPRVVIRESGREVPIGASGAIAGLMGRIDGTRGVWKAPAGTEATLNGVVGVEQQFTDDQNGVMNPRAVNLLRTFPDGIVSWGARTMDGDDDFGSEYKYVPVRRLALYIEETLYRALKWVVFEPNDEPLWAQIRLNVGAFMQGLFRKGAFEGKTPKEAYFVRCDGETTTATDRNLGIVNIWVGFAPLKPAEFVIIYIQQIAAQAEV